MAFGMNLGIQAGMGGGAAGVPPRRDSYKRFGSSLRAGGGRSYSSFAGTPPAPGMPREQRAPDADRLAREAAEEAQRTAAMSRSAGSIPRPQEDSTRGVAVLGGGTMGLKPDFTEVEQLEKEYARSLEKRPSWLAGFSGIGDVFAAKDEAWQRRIQMAQQKAIRDALAANQEAERARAGNTWNETKSTTASGQVIRQNALSGETRPAFVATKKEEYDWGPEIGGSTTFTTEEPEMDQTIVEKNRQAAIKAREAKEAEAARNREIAALGKKEIEVATAQSKLRRGEDIAGVNARKAAGAYDSPAKPEKGPTVNDIRETVLARMGFAGEQDFRDNATMDDRVAFKAAMTEATAPAAAPGRDPAQGRKIAAPAPKFKKGEVYRGRTFIGEDGADPNDLKNWSSPK